MSSFVVRSRRSHRSVPKELNTLISSYLRVEVNYIENRYRNGIPQSIHIRRNGLYREYYDDGSLDHEVHYKNGLHHGSEKIYEGVLFHEMNWINGKINGPNISYYANGGKEEEETYVDGIKEGISRIWHENGRLHTERNFKNGKLSGTLRKWTSKGELAEESEYIDGLLHGLSKKWYDGGKELSSYDDEN